MQTITLRARSSPDGMVRLEVPTNIPESEIEIVLVIQPIATKAVDAMGYPIGYFEETYGSFADDPLERNQPAAIDTREPFE